MRPNRSGFTLLETVVALAIAGAVAGAVLAMAAGQFRAFSDVEPTLAAAELGRERLTALQFAPLGPFAGLPDSMTAGTVPLTSSVAYWSARVTPVPGEAGLYRASVRVQVRDRTVEFSTLLFRPPLASARP